MKKIKTKIARKQRIRKKIKGNSQRPRLTVFKSNTHIYAQIIDDSNSKTLVSASDIKMKKTAGTTLGKLEKAAKVGEVIAIGAQKNKITEVVFDRGSYKYHGRIKALAQSARKGGLNF